MEKMNTQSALLSAHLASKFLAEQGLLVFTGAAKVFEGPTNFALAYGLSKQATHSLALHMAEREGIPKSADVVTILPTTIDTPANRESMPNDDHSIWLPPDNIANLVRAWAEGENRPVNGSFAKLNFQNGAVVPQFL